MWMKIYGFIQGFQAVPMLLFGAVLHELISRFDLMSILENKKIRYVVALSGLVILIAASFIWDGHIELHRGRLGDKYVYYPYAMLVFIGYFAIVAGLSHLRWLSLPVGYIGRWSLFIFCTHAMVLEYVERYLSEPAEVFAVTLSISVILAFAASKSTLLKKLYLF